MAEQIRDALRHLEKDMADILDVLTDTNTTEVILNPYRKPNGSYDGYILIEQHGKSLRNLVRYHEYPQGQITLAPGDTLVYKYLVSDPEQILFWTKLNHQFNFDLRQLALCLKSNFTSTSIMQSEDFALLNYADMLGDG